MKILPALLLLICFKETLPAVKNTNDLIRKCTIQETPMGKQYALDCIVFDRLFQEKLHECFRKIMTPAQCEAYICDGIKDSKTRTDCPKFIIHASHVIVCILRGWFPKSFPIKSTAYPECSNHKHPKAKQICNDDTLGIVKRLYESIIKDTPFGEALSYICKVSSRSYQSTCRTAMTFLLPVFEAALSALDGFPSREDIVVSCMNSREPEKYLKCVEDLTIYNSRVYTAIHQNMGTEDAIHYICNDYKFQFRHCYVEPFRYILARRCLKDGRCVMTPDTDFPMRVKFKGSPPMPHLIREVTRPECLLEAGKYEVPKLHW